MFNIDEYNNLTSKYCSFASWAIWDYKNAADTEIINKNYDQLHSKFVLLGLNMSRLLVSPSWSNFHDNTHARKLKYACNDTILRGSYLTDIFKDLIEPTATNIQNMLTEKIRSKNVELFKREMMDIKINENTQFIIFGKLAGQYFNKYFKQDFKNNVIYHNHYSSRGTDRQWVNSFWKKLNINQDYDLTIKKYKL